MSLGGIVGAVIGFAIGGPKGALYGYQIGSTAESILNPPKGPNLVGPRLSDLSVQTATYGATIPRAYGVVPIVGNVFWLENNALKEVSTTTESGGKGGGGGSVTTYSYFATFAVGLCKGPITGVRRIWIGSKLLYDASSTSIETRHASDEFAETFRLYLGDDTQTADARMQADVGAANCSAYRGLAYLVFDDYPLADHGNSLLGAPVKVEVVMAGATAIPTHLASPVAVTLASSTRYLVATFENAGIYGGTSVGGTIRQYEEVVYNLDGSVRIPPIVYDDASLPAGTSPLACCRNWRGLIASKTPTGGLYGWANPLTGTYLAIGAVPAWAGTLHGLVEYQRIGNRMCGVVNASGSSIRMLRYPISTPADGVPDADYDLDIELRADMLSSTYTRPWADGSLLYVLYQRNTGTHEWMLYSYDTDGVEQNWWNLGAPTGAAAAMVFMVNAGLLVTRPTSGGIPLAGEIYQLNADHTVTKLANGILGNTGGTIYNTVQPAHGLDGIAWWPGEVYAFSGILTGSLATLSSIVSAECLLSQELEAGDIDVTALTQSVRGYRVGNIGSIRSAIEPLQAPWPFDIVQSGYQIQFVARGGASVATIDADELDARPGGAAPGVALTLTREMDTQLPRKLLVSYLDADREYDTGTQYDERLNTGAVNVVEIDLPVVLTSAEAAAAAQVLLYMYWFERMTVSDLRLPPSRAAIEPADVITIAAANADYPIRLTSIAYGADGRLQCAGRLANAAVYTATAVGESGQATPTAVDLAGPTAGVLLDIPVVVAEQDAVGFVVAIGGYTAGWPGGALYQSADSGSTWASLKTAGRPGSTIGIASNALAAHDGLLIDKASVLSVGFYAATLASVTEAQMLNGANLFAYGADGRWEIIGAQTCTEQIDGTWKLTDLLRGRYGTEWASGLHLAGDHVVALDRTSVAFAAVPSGSIGLERHYRPVTVNQSIDTASNQAFTYRGMNLECLSPVYLNGARDPSTNDWALTWVRRTRTGGEWRDAVDAALGEAREAYEVDIFADGTYATVKRTLTASTATAAYTSAQQVTDFGSNQSTLYVKVYQLSELAGRGTPLTTSITR